MATSVLRTPASVMRSRTYELALIMFGVLVALVGSAVIGKTEYGLYVVGGAVAVVGGVAVLLRPTLGLYFLFVFIYSNMSAVLEELYGIPDLNKFLIVLLFVGTLASRVVLLKKPLIFRMTEIVIMLYGAVVTASLFLAPEADGAIAAIVDWLKDFIILLIIVQFATEEHVWKRTQWLLIATAALLGLLNTIQTVTQSYDNTFWGFSKTTLSDITQDEKGNRLCGPLDDPNFYGMSQAMVLPLAMYRFQTDPNRRNRILALIAMLFIVVAIVTSYSRGAFLATVVVVVLFIRERHINPIKVVLAIALIAIAVVPVMPKGFAARLTTLGSIVSTDSSQQSEDSLRGRSSEMIVALQMFQDYPILGVGRGHYVDNYLNYAAYVGLDDRYTERKAHSLYLELAAETGILGIFTFGLMIVALFRGMAQATHLFKQINRSDLLPWVTAVKYGLIVYLIASIFLHGDYIRYFWLIVGLSASCSVLAQAQRLRLADPRLMSRISPIT